MLESTSVNDTEKGLPSPVLTASLAPLVPLRNYPPLHGSGNNNIDDPPEKVSTETAHPTAVQKVPQPPTKSAYRKASRWILFQLWFNTYRYVAPSPDPLRKGHLLHFHPPRKLFTLVISTNIAGIICAMTGRWNHPRNYSGACVLGNLLLAILMRNELFGRFLYLIVNACFAKVVNDLDFC